MHAMKHRMSGRAASTDCPAAAILCSGFADVVTMAIRSPLRSLRLQLFVEDTLPGVAHALQRGRTDIEQQQVATGATLGFAFDVELVRNADGELDLRGPHVQGPRGARFVYLNSGTLASQRDTCWTRRAKIPLATLLTAAPASVFAARIAGRARDGGPACASVPLLGGTWVPCERVPP
jgi:hypothetical protein